MPKRKHKERKRVCAPCTVPSVLKLLTFHLTIALQLQIDLGHPGVGICVGSHEVA